MNRPVLVIAFLVAAFLGAYLTMGFVVGGHAPVFVYNAIDEGCKAILAIWSALFLTSNPIRFVLFVGGLAFFVGIGFTWMPDAFTEIYVTHPDWPGYAINDFYVRTIHFVMAAAVLLALQIVFGLRMTRSLGTPPLEWSGQYSIRMIMLVMFVVGALLAGAQVSRTLITEHASSLVIFAFDAIRLALIAVACVFTVFVAQYRFVSLILACGLSVCLSLLMPYAFRLESSWVHVNWAAYAVIQFLIVIVSLFALRWSGYRLTRYPVPAK